MVSKRSYVRLFSMAVLLAGWYVSVRADGPTQCDDGPPPTALACYGGVGEQCRDSPYNNQACANACSGCGYGSSSYNYPSGGTSDNGCGSVLFCLCDGGLLIDY